MKLITRTQSLVFAVTTAIVFYLWGYIEGLILSNPLIGAILGGFIALGTYRTILKIVTIILELRGFLFIKKRLFGQYYLEGTWIGVYINSKKEPSYVIESFEQTYDETVIRGRAYYGNGEYRGSYISDSVHIDAPKGILSYTYHRNSIDVTFVNQGQAEFSFIRDKNITNQMMGFYCDIFTTEKTKALLVKVKGGSESELINKAKELHDNNHDFFK